MAIKQGTTPTHTFVLPFDTDIIKTIRIIYAQCNKVLFVKTNGQVRMSDNTAETTLTQEETFKFDRSKLVEIQLRVLTTGDNALESDPFLVSVDKCLEEVIMQ